MSSLMIVKLFFINDLLKKCLHHICIHSRLFKWNRIIIIAFRYFRQNKFDHLQRRVCAFTKPLQCFQEPLCVS